MATVVQKPLITEARLLKNAYFQNPDGHQDSLQFRKVLQIVDQLTLQDFEIPETFPILCTEGVVLKEYGVRISLFFIPKGTRTSLHDHPKMYVMNKVLKGKFQKYQYTLIESEFQTSIPQQYLNSDKKSGQFQFPIILASKSVEEIRTGDVGLITPLDNLHSFYTEEDSIFLDVIAPDYDDIEIFFNTYEELEALGDEVKLKMGPPKLQQNYMIKVTMV